MALRFNMVRCLMLPTIITFLWLLLMSLKNSLLRLIFFNFVKNKRFSVGKKYPYRMDTTIANKSISISVFARLITSGTFLTISVALPQTSILTRRLTLQLIIPTLNLISKVKALALTTLRRFILSLKANMVF